jgi:hypothetical protein
MQVPSLLFLTAAILCSGVCSCFSIDFDPYFEYGVGYGDGLTASCVRAQTDRVRFAYIRADTDVDRNTLRELYNFRTNAGSLTLVFGGPHHAKKHLEVALPREDMLKRMRYYIDETLATGIELAVPDEDCLLTDYLLEKRLSVVQALLGYYPALEVSFAVENGISDGAFAQMQKFTAKGVKIKVINIHLSEVDDADYVTAAIGLLKLAALRVHRLLPRELNPYRRMAVTIPTTKPFVKPSFAASIAFYAETKWMNFVSIFSLNVDTANMDKYKFSRVVRDI